LSASNGEDFTVVAIPDTQHYSETAALSPIFGAQTQWIVNSRSSLNTVFATHLGDIVENNGASAEWTRASAHMATLDSNAVANGVLPGNHDMNLSGSGVLYDQFFAPSRYQGFGWYGGYLGSSPADPVNRLNKDNYERFSAGGIDFLIIHLEHDMPAYAVEWAQRVIDAHPGRKVIISTHAFVNQNNIRPTSPASRVDGTSAEAVWQQLISPNCNVFMVLNGHYHGEGRRTDLNSCGEPVFQLNSDYQDDPNGGNGWLRYYTFRPSEDRIDAFTYSPTLNNGNGQFQTDANSQFTLDWEMAGDTGFVEIGTIADVPSGTEAVLPWNDLEAGDEYEWYVTVSDGAETTTGPIWSFATEDPAPPPAIFSDDFSSGTFSNWTSTTRLTIATGTGSPSAPSARAQVSNQSAFAVRNLSQTLAQGCFSVNVNLASGTNIDLFRLRTTANGPIVRVYAGTGGILTVRSDFSGAQLNSGVAIGSGWHAVELCGTVGSSSTWDLYRDGVKIVNAWPANTGTTPIGLLQIGDNAAKTFTANFDNARLDLVPN
jgi:hypothetical protein